MNHISIATPQGLDNVFFSFLDTLAAANDISSCDGPAVISKELKIEDYVRNHQLHHRHELLIGYRYPPTHSTPLVKLFESTIILADLDGISCQLLEIQNNHGGIDLASAYQFLRQAIEDYLAVLVEPNDAEHKPRFMMIPARALRIDAVQAFQRIETFYSELGVPIHNSVATTFSASAADLINQTPKVSNALIDDVLNIMTANASLESQLKVINELSQLID